MERHVRLKMYCWGLLGSIVLLCVGTANLRAELAYHPPTFDALPPMKIKAGGITNDRWQRDLGKLGRDWQEIRELLLQSALETTLTMFWVKVPTPPKQPPADPGGNGATPKNQNGGSNNPPGNPTGQGDPGGDPTTIPDPNTAPEPSSLVAAILGVGIVSLTAWRKRRKQVA